MRQCQIGAATGQYCSEWSLVATICQEKVGKFAAALPRIAIDHIAPDSHLIFPLMHPLTSFLPPSKVSRFGFDQRLAPQTLTLKIWWQTDCGRICSRFCVLDI